MTIDEEIRYLKEDIENNIDCGDLAAAENNKQRLAWLEELKALREENDTLKTGIIAVKSGSDVLKICKLEEENAELKKYINQLDEEQKSIDEFATAVHEEYKREIAELKRLLKLAVEDIKTLLCSVGAPIYSREGRESCKVCCFNHKCGCSNYCSVRTAYKKWKHAEEALEVLGDEK